MLQKTKKKILQSYKLNSLKTKLYAYFAPCKTPKINFIFGCQRSGTTMLANLINFSPQIKVYGEGDPPYFHQNSATNHLRLKPKHLIRNLLKKEKNPYILLKPLYESQNATNLLESFTDAKAIWIFRNYLDVVDSHIKYYKGQNALQYLSGTIDPDQQSWKNENLSTDIKLLIQGKIKFHIAPSTAYSLFWLARNSLFFNLKNKNVLLVNYENLVKNPVDQTVAVCQHFALPFKEKYASIIHSKAIGKKINFDIDKEVKNLCDEMTSRLLNYANK